MNFDKLPYLVQSQILKNFTYQELILLSLCSRKVLNAIKFALNTKFKCIKYITHENPLYNISIAAVDDVGNKNEIVRIVPRCHLLVPPTQVRILSKKIDVCISAKYTFLPVAYDPPNRMLGQYYSNALIAEVIHEHIYTIFGDFPEYRAAFDMFCAAVLPKLKKVKWSNLSGVAIDPTEIDSYFDDLPKHNFVNLHVGKLDKSLGKNSKLYMADVVHFREPYLNIIPILMHNFTGRYAFLESEICWDASLFNPHLVKFLSLWQSNTGLPELKVLTYKTERMNWPFDLETLMCSVNVKKCPQSRKPLVFQYTKSSLSKLHQTQQIPFSFETQAYIVRTDDKKVASICIRNGEFHFGVWDLTEKQFLELLT